jgi:hypothetical protein
MSLIKTHEMTEEQLAAIRWNQEFSHGPVTEHGRGRIRTPYRIERRMGAVSRDVIEK